MVIPDRNPYDPEIKSAMHQTRDLPAPAKSPKTRQRPDQQGQVTGISRPADPVDILCIPKTASCHCGPHHVQWCRRKADLEPPIRQGPQQLGQQHYAQCL
jgi:hypothetical protein